MVNPVPYRGGLLGDVAATPGYDQGLLGRWFDNPLAQFGMALLAQPQVSLTPQGPFEGIGRAGIAATAAQQKSLENELYRRKIAESAAQTKAQEDLLGFVEAAGDTPLVTGIPNKVLAAGLRVDPTSFSKLIPQAMTAEDQLQLLQTKATIAKLLQEQTAGEAETTTPAGSIVRSIDTLTNTYKAIEATPGGNIFAPGNSLYKDSLAGQYGINADNALGTPDWILSKFGDPATIREQAQQAQLIDKETATISRNLQTLAQKAGGGKSATAIDQMQTSLGEGNIGIPVRMKVLSSTLDTVIDDLQTKGIDVPEYWFDLQSRLAEATKSVGLNTRSAKPTQGYNPQQGLTSQPPTEAVVTPPSGVNPGAWSGLTDLFGGIFGGGGEAATAAPAAPTPAPAPAPRAAPPIKGVKTSEFGLGSDGQSAPIYRDPKAAEAALTELKRKGVKEVIVVDPATGKQYLLGVD